LFELQKNKNGKSKSKNEKAKPDKIIINMKSFALSANEC